MPLLTLDEAKAQLNITASDTGQDTELQAYIDALAPVIESYIGPVEPQEFTEQIDSRNEFLAFTQTPVQELLSLTPVLPGGLIVDLDDVSLDGPRGILRRLDWGVWWGGPWTVVYTAGRSEVPPTVNLAARMLLQHLWVTQNRTSGGVIPGGDDYSVNAPSPGFGYAVPNRVLELLAPYKRGPGVA